MLCSNLLYQSVSYAFMYYSVYTHNAYHITEHMCLSGTPPGSVKIQSSQLPQVTEFKYPGSTLNSDDDMIA